MKGVRKDSKVLVFCLLVSFLWATVAMGVTVNVKTDLVTLGIYSRNAAGDGTTNDDAPIDAAINYVIGQGGGTVYCPAGTYRVVRVHDDASVNFVGEGKGLTFFRPYEKSTRLFDFRGGLLADLTIYGTYPAYSGENWVCEGHPGGHGIVATDVTSRSLIKNVRVYEVKLYALYSRDCNGLWVVDCEFDKTGTNTVAIDPQTDDSVWPHIYGKNENFVFANCKFGPYRSLYLFNIEPTSDEYGDEYVRNGVILNCKYLGTDSGKYGTSINLWGCFLSLKGFSSPGERKNIAVVGCDFNDVWIHINRSFPDTQFSYNRIDGDYPIFGRSLGDTSVLPDAIVQGNYFVGKKYWSQIASETNFTGNSVFRCNTPSGANWESCSCPGL